MRILTAESDDGLAFAWPLTARRTLGATVLANLGEPMCQYQAALFDRAFEPATLAREAIARLAASGADLLRLGRVRADTPIAEALLASGATVVRRTAAPYVDLKRGRLACSERGGKAAATRRRRLRQLEARGPVQFGLAIGRTQARESIATAMRFKRAWAIGSAV